MYISAALLRRMMPNRTTKQDCVTEAAETAETAETVENTETQEAVVTEESSSEKTDKPENVDDQPTTTDEQLTKPDEQPLKPVAKLHIISKLDDNDKAFPKLKKLEEKPSKTEKSKATLTKFY